MKKTFLAAAIAASLMFSAGAFATDVALPSGVTALAATSSVNGGTSSQSVLSGVGTSQHGASATSQNTSWATAATTPGVQAATASANTGTNGTTTTSAYGVGQGFGDAYANQAGAAAATASATANKANYVQNTITLPFIGTINVPGTHVGSYTPVGSVAATSNVTTGTGSGATAVNNADVKSGTSGQATNGTWASVSAGLGNTVVTNAIGASNDFTKVDGFVNYATSNGVGSSTATQVVGNSTAGGTYAGTLGASK